MKDIYVNISFDDLHPEDGWGNIGDNVMNKLIGLKEKFPDIKYTFFANSNFEYRCDETKLSKLIKRRLHLLGFKNKYTSFKKIGLSDNFDIAKHKKRCEFVIENINNGTFEIGIHGYNHYQKYLIPGAEFLGLSSEENIKKIKSAEKMWDNVGIKYTKTFRSPAWGENSTLLSDLLNLGYKYISLDPKLCNLVYNKKEKYFLIPQNYSIESSDYDCVFRYLKDNNYLFIKGHLYDKLENGIREDTIDNLKNLICILKNKYTINFIKINNINDLYLDSKIQKIHEI